ncbi:hypothetical protein FACS1894188_01260 [Clostridia bacterium]|nr:hypothetical protein FACS1894188_01260 [Clostridia bacterium]
MKFFKTFYQFLYELHIPILSNLIKFIFWKLVDFYRWRTQPRKVHLYGIWCFVGVYGGGKTMSLVHYLERMRKKYGNKIIIATNFFYKNQDFAIETWKDLLPEYGKPVIFGYDELQNEFSSREYKGFPVDLMRMLTQNRKGHGKQIVYTTQKYSTVDKQFRNQTTKVAKCKTFLGRFTRACYYLAMDFEELENTTSVKGKMKIRPYFVDCFVQSDSMRELFDSYQFLESAKSKDYYGLGNPRETYDPF